MDDLEIFELKQKQNFVFKLNEHDKRIALSLIDKFKSLNEYELIKQVKLTDETKIMKNDCN